MAGRAKKVNDTSEVSDDDIFAALNSIGSEPADEKPEVKEETVAVDTQLLAIDARLIEAGELSSDDTLPMPIDITQHDPDDPFGAGFRTCYNDGCDLRAGCLRYRLKSSRDQDMQMFFFADDHADCHVKLSDPAYYGKFALDPL